MITIVSMVRDWWRRRQHERVERRCTSDSPMWTETVRALGTRK